MSKFFQLVLRAGGMILMISSLTELLYEVHPTPVADHFVTAMTVWIGLVLINAALIYKDKEK
jgi:hypothetical protein